MNIAFADDLLDTNPVLYFDVWSYNFIFSVTNGYWSLHVILENCIIPKSYKRNNFQIYLEEFCFDGDIKS